MKKFFYPVISVVLIVVMIASLVFIATGSSNEAQAAPVAAPLVNCTDFKVGQQVKIVCTAAGVTVLNTTVNLPVAPPVQLPGETETVRVPVPGPTETVRVPVPGPTRTVEVPVENSGPTATVTIPGDTQTVTASPEPRPTRTVTASPTPSATSDPSTPGQGDTTTATIDPAPEDEDNVVTIPRTEINTPEALGLGTAAVLGIIALILLGMYAGYYMGYKDSDKEEAKFYKALLGK